MCCVLLHLLRFQMEARSSLPLVQSFMERSRFRMGGHSSSVEAIKG